MIYRDRIVFCKEMRQSTATFIFSNTGKYRIPTSIHICFFPYKKKIIVKNYLWKEVVEILKNSETKRYKNVIFLQLEGLSSETPLAPVKTNLIHFDVRYMFNCLLNFSKILI